MDCKKGFYKIYGSNICSKYFQNMFSLIERPIGKNNFMSLSRISENIHIIRKKAILEASVRGRV